MILETLSLCHCFISGLRWGCSLRTVELLLPYVFPDAPPDCLGDINIPKGIRRDALRCVVSIRRQWHGNETSDPAVPGASDMDAVFKTRVIPVGLGVHGL